MMLAKFARRTLRRHLARFCEAGPAAVKRGQGDELHALRVSAKQLRYNLEFFRSLLVDDAKNALDLLAKLQERLGSISDDDAFAHVYARLLQSLDEHDPRRTGLLARIEANRQDRRRELDALRDLWSGGEDKAYPKRLRAAISEALSSLSKVRSPESLSRTSTAT
jgi:CHAD domain-containing protein